jgi:hypothetical protein
LKYAAVSPPLPPPPPTIIIKDKTLSVEIQQMWNMKCFVVLVITGATGIVTKGLKNIWGLNQESIQ